MDGKDVFFLFAASTLALDALGHLPMTPQRKKTKDRSGMTGLDESDELPPPDLEYDNEPPCHLPSVLEANPNGDDVGYCKPPADLEPKVKTGISFGAGGTNPQWPISTEDEKKVQVSYEDVRGKWHGKWGRHFGSTRKGDSGVTRHHVGVDLFADPNDKVVAMEDGEILAVLPFHLGTWAIYVKNDSGQIVNYGELKKDSWLKYGIKRGIETGQRVYAGQPLGKPGQMGEQASTMLHLEMFEGDTAVEDIREGKLQWIKGETPNLNILDPTRYLVRAQRRWFNERMPEGPDVT